jgi:hypothetical protein
MRGITRVLDDGWTFTQTRGGQKMEDGEWLETSAFPTSVHVELLRLKKIPDPVRSASRNGYQRDANVLIYDSSLGSMSGIYSVRATAGHANRCLNCRSDCL